MSKKTATDIAQATEAVLRQRLGKERMELWFGSAAKWAAIGNNTVRVEVASEFLSDCISRMFRGDLQAAVREAAGSDWGFQVAVSPVVVAEPVATPPATRTLTSSIVPSESKVTTVSSLPLSMLPATARPMSRPVAAEQLDSIESDVTVDVADAMRDVDVQLDRHDVDPLEAGQTDYVARAGLSLRVVREETHSSDDSNSTHTIGARVATSDVSVDRLLELRKQNERRWDEFVPGEHNRLAYTAAQMVLERPGQINPLLLHGPNGVGKSHLALGIAHRLRQQHRMRRVLVLTGEQFTIEYTESARGGGFANFRRKYRDVDAIVIDDIQFCLGKSGTLVELRNTIDMLLRDQRQVILVADRSLNDLAALGTDLYARLAGGMVCSIDPMDAATRLKVLSSLCAKQNVALEQSALKQLATQCGGDARVLQGIVHRLVAQQRLVGRPLLDEEAVRCSLELIRASQPIVRIVDIEKAVCEAFGLDDKMLRAKSKCQSVSQPRMLAMFLARKYTRTALSEIGEFFGNRQHSTVISAQKKVESWLESDEAIALGRTQVSVREILKGLEASLQVG